MIIIDNYLNVVSSVLSIGAIISGGIVYLLDKKSKRREWWVDRFLMEERRTTLQTRKPEMIAECLKEYGEQKTKSIYIEALDRNGVREKNAIEMYEKVKKTIGRQ